MKISFINAVSRICELTGADITQVAHAVGKDSRIGPEFLKAGVGYGGSCFPKDVDAFIRMGDGVGYSLDLLKAVQKINFDQKDHLMRTLQQELWVLEDKTIAIWGLAFKAGTDDVRQAPALHFVEGLKDRGATMKLWDPVASDKFKEVHPDQEYCDSLIDCAREADAVLVLTAWPDIQQVDLNDLRSVMKHPVVIDGRNVFDPAVMAEHGFTYHSVGRPAVRE